MFRSNQKSTKIESAALKNNFRWHEWSGAVGDLGTLLPLAFALIIFNGFVPQRLFFLWGLAYVLSGWYYKVPVSIQPLKAMSVIAISMGYATNLLSTTSFFYGILLVVLASTGIIKWLQNWFTPALVRGIQLGIGLILAVKAMQLVLKKGLLLSGSDTSLWVSIGVLVGVLLLLWLVQFRKNIPIVLLLIVGSIIGVKVLGISPVLPESEDPIAQLQIPNISFLWIGLVYLMIPQLPLTLGNAVFAADDACHTFWGKRARRVNPTRLGMSIGVSNIFIGMLGGFPICHGAGGIGAHAQFGGKTGGTTIIIGSLLILTAVIPDFSEFIFLIPVPILSAMLLFDSWRMMLLTNKLSTRVEIGIAILVGLISFATRNLSIALIAGFIVERAYAYFQQKVETSPERSE